MFFGLLVNGARAVKWRLIDLILEVIAVKIGLGLGC